MQYPTLPKARVFKSKKTGDEMMGTCKLYRVMEDVNNKGYYLVLENNLLIKRTETLNEAVAIFETL